MTQSKKQYRPAFFEDPLRAWNLEITFNDGSKKTVIVDPSGYESVLKDPSVKSVEINSFLRKKIDLNE